MPWGSRRVVLGGAIPALACHSSLQLRGSCAAAWGQPLSAWEALKGKLQAAALQPCSSTAGTAPLFCKGVHCLGELPAIILAKQWCRHAKPWCWLQLSTGCFEPLCLVLPPFQQPRRNVGRRGVSKEERPRQVLGTGRAIVCASMLCGQDQSLLCLSPFLLFPAGFAGQPEAGGGAPVCG